MKKIILFVIASIVFGFANAQSTFQRTFETTTGDGGSIIQQTQDKGYVLLSFNILSGYSYIVKTDSLGNKTWSKKINNTQYAFGLNQTLDGGYILSGFITGVGGYLIKLNSSGNIFWQKTYCFASSFNYVKDDIDGTGYIAVGGIANGGLTLMKIDFSGNVIWRNKILPTAPFNTISGGFVQFQSDSSIITLGSTRNNYKDSVWCSKFTKTGTNIWIKVITTGVPSHNWHLSIKETYTGNVMLFYDGTFVEMDTSGTPVSSMYYNGTGGYLNGWDFAKPAIDKSMFLTGYIQNQNGTEDIFLLKTDSLGNAEWSRRIGGANSDAAHDVVNDGNNGCAVIGTTNSFSASSNGAIYFVKTDSTGTLSCNADTLPLPTVQFLTAATANFPCIISSPTCNNSSISFNSSNPTDISYDACGCVPPVANFSTGYPNQNFGYIQDNSTWASTWYWDYGNGQTDSSVIPYPNYTTDSIYYVCLTVSNACGTDTFCDSLNYVYVPINVQEIQYNSIFKITPNPTNADFIISFEKMFKKGNVEILNILGESVYSENIYNESKKELNLENVSNGIYFVKVFDGEKSYCKKLIVEHN